MVGKSLAQRAMPGIAFLGLTVFQGPWGPLCGEVQARLLSGSDDGGGPREEVFDEEVVRDAGDVQIRAVEVNRHNDPTKYTSGDASSSSRDESAPTKSSWASALAFEADDEAEEDAVAAGISSRASVESSPVTAPSRASPAAARSAAPTRASSASSRAGAEEPASSEKQTASGAAGSPQAEWDSTPRVEWSGVDTHSRGVDTHSRGVDKVNRAWTHIRAARAVDADVLAEATELVQLARKLVSEKKAGTGYVGSVLAATLASASSRPTYAASLQAAQANLQTVEKAIAKAGRKVVGGALGPKTRQLLSDFVTHVGVLAEGQTKDELQARIERFKAAYVQLWQLAAAGVGSKLDPVVGSSLELLETSGRQGLAGPGTGGPESSGPSRGGLVLAVARWEQVVALMPEVFAVAELARAVVAGEQEAATLRGLGEEDRLLLEGGASFRTALLSAMDDFAAAEGSWFVI